MRGANRLRGYRARAQKELRHLQPVRRTVLHTPADHVPPRPSAFAAFGTNSWVVPPARVIGAAGISIGSNVVVMEHSTLAVLDGGRLTLGDGVLLARCASIVCAGSITLEDDVMSSDGISLGDTWRLPFGDSPTGLGVPAPAPIHVGRGAYLGCNSTILPGVTVGEGAYVAEAAVVTEDVPAHSVAQGNPARIIRRYDPDTGTWEGKRWP